MSQPKKAVAPTIDYLNPNSVAQGWAGPVSIYGNGFDAGSFAIFDAANPPSHFKSSSLLVADVDTRITGTVGSKRVWVHTSEGGISNEVAFVVTKKR